MRPGPDGTLVPQTSAARRWFVEDQYPQDEMEFLYANGFEIPDEPERYLAIERQSGDPVFGYFAATLPELAKMLDESDTTRDDVDVVDLDTETWMRMESRIVAFRFSSDGKTSERTEVLTVEPVFVPTEKDLAYIAAAREDSRVDDECEIDDNPKTSDGGGGGAWVAAWLWITNDDAGICSKCGEPGANNGEGYDGMCGNCADKEENESESK